MTTKTRRWTSKLVAFSMAALLTCVLAGCGASASSENEPTNETSADSESVAQDASESEEEQTNASANSTTQQYFTLDSTVGEVESDPAFEGFGQLLFPVDLDIDENMTLREVSSSSVYLWYSNIQPDETVAIVNDLKSRALSGEQVFYPIYTADEIAQDPSKANTGLFYFKGAPGNRFAIMNAGGGFYYVGAMHDSFPHALEASKRGYNAFALIYRPTSAYDDLARAICYIEDNAAALEVDTQNYSLWGGSAGARMAAGLGNNTILHHLTGRNDIPQAAAVIMQYTGYDSAYSDDAPTYACVGTNDSIASPSVMRQRLETLADAGIPTEFHVYSGLSHGFGLGTGTVAEGWIDDAFAFWDAQSA